jgi:RNA polymerase sigma factor (sigma-70 family)
VIAALKGQEIVHTLEKTARPAPSFQLCWGFSALRFACAAAAPRGYLARMPAHSEEDSPATRRSLLAEAGRDPQSPRWEELHQRYAPLLRVLARRHGLSEADAADLQQEVFRTLVTRLATFEHNGRPGAFRKYLRQAGDWAARSLKRRQSVRPAESLDHAPGSAAPPPEALVTRARELSEAECERVLIEALAALQQRLPPRDVLLLDLYYRQNWTAAATGRHLTPPLSAAAVEKRAGRLVDALRAEVRRRLA